MALQNRGNKMSNDERIAVLETTSSHILTTLDEIKLAISKIDTKLDSRFDSLNTKIDSRFDKLNDRMWSQFYWMVGGFAGVLMIMAHGFHWI
jgi:uncharacterized coiled-coil protein SlyX